MIFVLLDCLGFELGTAILMILVSIRSMMQLVGIYVRKQLTLLPGNVPRLSTWIILASGHVCLHFRVCPSGCLFAKSIFTHLNCSISNNRISAYWVECWPIDRETWVQSQVESNQILKKWYLMPPCLTLSIIR